MAASAWNLMKMMKKLKHFFCRFLDDNFKLPISAYAPSCVPKIEIKERLFKNKGQRNHPYIGSCVVVHIERTVIPFGITVLLCSIPYLFCNTVSVASECDYIQYSRSSCNPIRTVKMDAISFH